MTEYKEILKAIEQRFIKQSEQLEFLYKEAESLGDDNIKLRKENKQLRDDLCELSREFSKNK